MRRSIGLALGLAFCAIAPAAAENGTGIEVATGLAGSHASMERQNAIARENDFSFVRTWRQVDELVDQGLLVPARGNADYKLANVSHPVTRPTTRLFVERLGNQYHQSCGQKLVVTSLTRPINEQPENASDLSVHPAGMAVDLRVPAKSSCRRWLEGQLLSLESKGVLDVTRERKPAHYHVAVFPEAYSSYVAPLLAADSAASAALANNAGIAAQLAADAQDIASRSAQVDAPRVQAGIGPGPGLFMTLVYALMLLSGAVFAVLKIRGPVQAPVEVRRKD